MQIENKIVLNRIYLVYMWFVLSSYLVWFGVENTKTELIWSGSKFSETNQT